MSVTTIPPGGLSLHGIPHGHADTKHTAPPVICFKLSEELLQDVEKASNTKEGLQFVTGVTPKIRLGKRTIDLTISSEAFRHELFSASTENLGILDFAGIVGHRAELKLPQRKQSLGSDAALAALQSSLASYHQEKAAKSVNYTGSVIAAPKNRFEANREQKHAHRRGMAGSHHGSPSVSSSATPRFGAGSTSVPTGDSEAKLRAMRKALVHLLAIEPLSSDGIVGKTKIPKDDLEEVLQKVGKPSNGKWTLSDRAYKELDVWRFAYRTQAERQEAIDNAVRAYDRQRIGKEEKIWQMLLPEEKRDQGIYLSKLAIGAGTTPNVSASPLHPGDAEEKAASVAITPRLGAGTPKVGSGKNDLMRKLAKNPKQRAIEEAKEKKRKEREAAAASSDKEGKPVKKKQTTVKNNPKVKSAELVQSSSESETGEITTAAAKTSSSIPHKMNASSNTATGKSTNATAKTKPMARTNASTSGSSSSSGGGAARNKPADRNASPAVKPKIGTPSSKPASASTSAASSTNKARTAPLGTGKSTPNGLHAPSSQSRSQLSPNKPQHRPTAPSPLGAARPRVASDVSDRGAIGVQRVKQNGEETPKGLGITNANGIRKRHDTVTSTDSSSSGKMNGDHARPTTARKSTANGTSTPRPVIANGTGHKSGNVLKRKQPESPPREERHSVKHRKTDSTSSHSQNSTNSVGARSSNAEALERSLSSDSASSVRPQLSYNQGVREAQRFHEELYPRYTKLYDEQVAMERRGERVPREDRQRLWAMHKRLELMKREIREASMREQDA